MNERQAIPAGLAVSGRVSVVGVLQEQRDATWLPSRKTHICRAVLEINQHDVTVVAYGEAAKHLAAALTGSGLQVDGQLVQHRWKVAANLNRERVEVEADKITTLDRVKRGMQ